MNNCLLCKSTSIREIAKIDPKKIVKMYLKAFNTDFSYLFETKQISLVECCSCGLRFYDPQVSGDERFYGTLQQFDWYYRKDKEEYKFASRYVKDNDQILDVGCGQGEFKRFIGDANFTGLEFSHDAIEKGCKNGRNILSQSIEEHATTNCCKYDVVVTFQVLEHVTKIEDFIKSCARCVKPGGYLIVAVPSEESYLQYGKNFILNMPPHHISRWKDQTLTSIARLINFDIRELHHDSLDSIHIQSYSTALVEQALPFHNFNSDKLINDSFSFRIRMKIAYVLSKKMSRLFKQPAWHPKGQSVTIVYQKPWDC